jgi:hypothetical protein
MSHWRQLDMTRKQQNADADDKKMNGSKTPWDTRKQNDERRENTFLSEGQIDGTESRSEFKQTV